MSTGLSLPMARGRSPRILKLATAAAAAILAMADDFDASVKITGTLIAEEPDALRIKFEAVTAALARLIVRHANRRQRFTPHLIRG